MSETTLMTGDGAGPKSDALLIRRAARCRWPVSDETKKKLVERVSSALDSADEPRDIASLGKVLTAMEAQNQADDHLQDKNDRLDSGKSTENVNHAVIVKGVDPEEL